MVTHFRYTETSPLALIGISFQCAITGNLGHVHRLKLLTGVETSTLPVNKSGNEGNRQIRSRRSTKAAPKTTSFRSIMVHCCGVLLFQLSLRDDSLRLCARTIGGKKKKLSRNFSSSYQQPFGLSDNHLSLWRKSRRRVCFEALEYRIFTANTLIRYLWPGQELHYQNSGRAQTSDLSPRFPPAMHLQG